MALANALGPIENATFFNANLDGKFAFEKIAFLMGRFPRICGMHFGRYIDVRATYLYKYSLQNDM